MASIFKGKKLVNNKNEPIDNSILDGKTVLIYFSAHWCPPCKRMTPILSAFYDKHHESKDFECVFVSSDRDAKSFESYHAEMSFPALSFDDRETKAALASDYSVSGIPSLVIVDKDGKLITKKGTEGVVTDTDAERFPWRPRSLEEIATSGPVLQKKKIGKDEGDKDGIEEVPFPRGKVVAFYFSAHWCGPCRSFTPRLKEAYKNAAAKGHDFEIVFVSSDKNDEGFNEYYSEMPWNAIPFGDPRCKELSAHFEVEGIPTLVIVGPNFSVIQANGRTAIARDTAAENFPWAPEPVPELDDPTPLNSGPCLVVFNDGPKAVSREDALKALLPVAKDLEAIRDGGEEKCGDGAAAFSKFVTLCTAGEDDGLLETVRQFAKLKETDEEELVLFDIPRGRKFVLGKGISEERVRDIVSKFGNNTLEGEVPIRG